jgi:hypothetical protein
VRNAAAAKESPPWYLTRYFTTAKKRSLGLLKSKARVNFGREFAVGDEQLFKA